MNNNAIQQLLTTIFMLLAVAAIVVFFVVDGRELFYTLGITAIVIRLVQYGIRFFNGRKRVKKVDFDFDNDKKR